jgi:hypothetical protein
VVCFAVIETILGTVGAAATKLKARLDMIYAVKTDGDGRKFPGLHETLLPLASTARSVFQQLRGTKAKKSATKRKQQGDGEAPESDSSRRINGHPHGRITGVDMRHLLLLLPFLLFDLLDDDISQYNTKHGTNHVGPAQVLISVVLALLEWYHLYRQADNKI